MLSPSIALCERELVRFVRQRSRIIGALVTPLVFWLLIGAGMGRSFQAGNLPGGDHYLRYFFPGTVLMILLFTAIFSTISIIEDRREGFLQGVLVAPVGREAVVLGKLLGGTILAFAQGLIFLLLAPTVGIHLTAGALGLSMLMMLIVSFALTGLGFCIAWRMSSTQGFHAIMNLFLMPMWFLSGALFPARPETWAPLKWVMRLNPLTYGLAGLRRAMYLGEGATRLSSTLRLRPEGSSSQASGDMPSLALCFGVSLVFAVVMFALSSAIARGRVEADLQ